MRIGIDTTSIPPQPVGAGRYIIELVRALFAANQEDEFVLFAQPHGKELINLPPSTQVTWHITPSMKPMRRLLWEQTFLPWIARKKKLDLLHSPHYTRPIYLPCRSVVTFHDLSLILYPQLHTRARRLFFPLMMRYSAKQCQAIIAVSENTRQEAIHHLGISAEKIITTPHGISKEFHPIENKKILDECRARYSLPEKFLLYVGTIEPRKNLPVLLQAYHQALRQGLDAHLVIVGSLGWMYEEVFKKIEVMNLHEFVHITGYIPQEDLAKVYNLAHVFIYPSLYEGFGLPPLEAMACGTPVIASDELPNKAYLAEAGILVPPGEPQSLSEAILKLAGDEKLRHSLSQKGTIMVANFSWNRTAQITLEVYRKVGAMKK